MYQITLIGPPQILYEGQNVEIKRRPTRALLFYLAASGQPISRAKLIDVFFQNEDEATGRAHLRETLGKLRGALPDPDLIQAGNESLSMDFSRAQVDALELRGVLSELDQHLWIVPEDKPLPPNLYDMITRAGDLWRGREFLSGVDFSFSAALENWQIETDGQIKGDLLNMGQRLIAHENRWGNPQNAVRWLRMSLTVNNLDEELHHLLLITLLNMNAQAEAQKHYELVQKLFESEMGMEPGEKIQSLAPRIFNRPAENKTASWTIHASVPAPFTGRETILEEIQRAYRVGGAIAIFGEAGGGKTRLVQEFYLRADNTPRPLIVSCYPLETNLPYQPWIDLLRKTISAEEWQSLEATWAAPLTMLLPELRDLRDDLPQAQQVFSEQSRTVLFESIHQILLTVADKQPILLFLDDAHWADESTLEIVAYLLKHSFFSEARGLLIMAARVKENNSPLDKLLLTSFPQRLRRIELGQLNQEEIAMLARSLLERDLPKRVIEQLLQGTGGNAFFLLEILQALRAMPRVDTPSGLPLLQSVQELIASRLQPLSENARETLASAAILGSHFSLPLLEKMVKLPGERIVKAIEELEQARLLQAQEKEKLTYAFIHEMIRESLLSGLSAPRKRLLYQKAAEALCAYLGKNTEPQAAVLAFYCEEAGDLPQAVDYWVQAAQYAYRLASVQGATEAYQRAERLVPRAASLTDDQIYALYASWSDMAFENDDPETLRRLNQHLLTLGQERGSDLLIGNAYDGLSDACFTANQFAEGMKNTEQAMIYLKRCGNTFELMEAQNHHGVFLYMQGRLRESQPWFRASLELGLGSADPFILRSLGNANYQMAITETILGFPREGIRFGKQSYEDYGRAHRPYGQVAALSVLGVSNYFLINFKAGYEACREGIEIAERLSGWRMLGYLQGYGSMNCLEMGLIGPAWEHAQKAMELGKRFGHGEIVGIGFKCIGDINTRLHSFPQAAQAYQQGIAAAGEHFVALENLHRLGYALAMLGQEAGLGYIQQVIDQTTQLELGSISIYAAIFKLNLMLHKGITEETEKYAAQLNEELSQRTGQTLVVFEQHKAEFAFQEGKLEEALELIQNVTRHFKATSLCWFELSALKLENAILQKMGRSSEETRQRIHKIFSSMEASIGDAPFRTEWQGYCHYILPEVEQ
jgi:DNA-binding SARP family transcriptional activator/tetratricopeptide (TPR) repeat protein